MVDPALTTWSKISSGSIVPLFLKPGEKSLLRQFLSSIEPEKVDVAPTEEAEDKGDDDFGELDDLDM